CQQFNDLLTFSF
nr:immunoglobulin light chain junction region [Macaca mulatta]MOV74331.1 immunoglobulin light chain junction region [Macaca mulatta]MOV75755.1 immunoglobulin light chain junction region [Macaca mulatta]